ncbi:MAG TPA: amidohydrolase [Vicinamibacteria bacterium]|nr:amidohydrolase [Vicinamibacteria bacterium]
MRRLPWLLLVAVAVAGDARAGTRADLALRGGRIWVGKGRPLATAIAMKDGRVAAVGSDAEVQAWVGPETRVIHLRGRLVVPGFNDAHVHFLSGGFGLLSVDLRDARDEQDFVRRIAAHVRTLPKGTWIQEGNWDHETWPSKTLPTRALIDAVTPDHPVFVQRLDGHMALANSLALRLAGVTRESRDPEGGTIVRDARGEPTGILKDNAEELVTRAIPEPSREMNLRAARAALREAARVGVTTIQDNSSVDALRTYQDLRAAGELTARFYVWRYASSALEPLEKAGLRTGLGDEWIRLGALKILSDGSMGSGTAAFFDPYTDDPKTSGLLLYPVPELERLIREADAAGFQLAVHAIGDRANSLVLDAFEKAAAVNPARERRFRIEHAQVVRKADLARYRRLGVIASIQPSHGIDDMRWAERRIGRERSRDAYNVRSFTEAGIPVAFGTDWFVEPLDPRLGLYAAVTRERPEGGPPGGWFPEEKIALEDALDLYTRGSAYAEFAEKEKGTLDPGMLADLVVFAADLFRIPAREILTTPVDFTVAGGRVVFDREAGEPGPAR